MHQARLKHTAYILLEMKKSESIHIFIKQKLKRVYGPNKSIKPYSNGHGRMRHGLSHLKHHLYYSDIPLYNQHIAITQLVMIYKKRPKFLLYCPRYGPQQRTILTEISKITFPGTSYTLKRSYKWLPYIFCA